jgi:4-amino-4-deoxy-L-arabinose transferase-like glycosyltransferase
MELFRGENSIRQRPHLSAGVLLVAILGLAFILRMKFWGQPFEMDEGAHAYMGWGILQGLVPYRDMYNGKPPGIYVLHTILFLLVKPTALNIKIFASFYALCTTLIVFCVTRKIAGQKAGIAAALLFGIFSPGPKIQGGGVNSEVFMVLPYTLAAYSFLRAVETSKLKHYLLFGLWTGLACSIKQVAGVNFFWITCYLLFRILRANEWQAVARTLKDGVWVAVGGVVSWLPFLLYFYSHKALNDFYFWQTSASFKYVADGYRGGLNFSLIYNQMQNVLSENGLLWILAFIGIVYAWRELQKRGTLGSDGEYEPWWRIAMSLLAIWPIFSFVGIAAGGRFFSHYFIQIIPSLAILGGMGLAGLVSQIYKQKVDFLRRPRSLVLAGAIVGSLALFLITDAPYYFNYDGIQISYRQYGSPLFSVTRFIGNYLGDRTQPEDLIYVWAVNPEINFYALRKSPTPYLMHVGLENIPWDPFAEVLQCLYRTPPKYVVAMQPIVGFPGLQNYVREFYVAESDPELDQLKQLIDFELYRLKGDGSSY